MRARKAGLLAAAAALSWSSSAFAQTEPGDIVVTARRVEERLQDVPISITAFTSEQLANRNVVTAQDLVSYTPSLTSNSRFGSDNVTFAIRGFVQETGTAPSVGVYFGDVVVPRGSSGGFPSGDGAGPGMFFDLQNVQVLKGAQGTLFGRNTTGGAILLVPQKPRASFEGYVEGSVGNFDMRRIQAVVNAPLGDSIRVRFGVDRQKRDGSIRNLSPVGPRRINDVNYMALRGSIVADLTPDLENYTILSYTDSDAKGPLQKAIVCRQNIPSFNPANQATIAVNFFSPSACSHIAEQDKAGFYTAFNAMPNPASKIKTWQAINTTTWQASETLTVKNIISYAEQRQILRTTLFGIYPTVRPNLPASYALYPDVPFNFTMINPYPGRSSSDQSTFTEELQLQGRSANDRMVWQAGGYIELSSPAGPTGGQTANSIYCPDVGTFDCTDVLSPSLFGFPVGAINVAEPRAKFRNYGLYAQGSYAVSDQLKFTAGIRYTWDEVSVNNKLFAYNLVGGVFKPKCVNLTTTLPDCRVRQTVSFDKPTWLIGIDYRPADDVLLYAKYTRGYRAGGIKTDGPSEYMTFDPEKVDSYEVGVKSTFGDAVPVTFNLSAFYNDFQNQQLQFGFGAKPASGVVATASPVNAGKSRIYGLESEVRVSPFEGLSLDASYAYLNTRVQEIRPVVLPASSPYLVNGQVLPGDELLLSPKHKLVLSVNYTLPFEEDIGRITIGGNYVYTGEQITNYADRFFTAFTGGVDIGRLPSTSIFNANVNWNSVGGMPVDLAVFATNITKRKYYVFVNGFLGGSGFETATLGEPRMFGVRLKYRFGE